MAPFSSQLVTSSSTHSPKWRMLAWSRGRISGFVFFGIAPPLAILAPTRHGLWHRARARPEPIDQITQRRRPHRAPADGEPHLVRARANRNVQLALQRSGIHGPRAREAD